MTRASARAARYSVCVLLGSAGLALAGAASAQGYGPPPYGEPPSAGGITVYGHPHYGHPRVSPYDDHATLSRGVTFSDLDLTTDAGVAQLKWRIDRAADALCRRLGERPEAEENTTVLPSCQAAARDSAAQQVDRAVSAARYWAAYRYSAPAYAPPTYSAPPVYSEPPAYSQPPAYAYGPPAYGYAQGYSDPPPAYGYRYGPPPVYSRGW